jgi:Tetratricopeptide repeat
VRRDLLGNQKVALEAVKRWLGSNQGWLLILDNADDIVMARAFLPSGKKGHVIFTTRAQTMMGIVAASLSNLAMLYCDQGQFAKAESLFKKALMISEHVFGPEHPDLAWSLNTSRISINSKGNMLRKNLFSNGRWRFGKKLLARSILT